MLTFTEDEEKYINITNDTNKRIGCLMFVEAKQEWVLLVAGCYLEVEHMEQIVLHCKSLEPI